MKRFAIFRTACTLIGVLGIAQAQGQAAVLSNTAIGTNGQLQMRLLAVPGQSYTLESSTNLQQWTSTGVWPDVGTNELTIVAPGQNSGNPSEFYRVKQGPVRLAYVTTMNPGLVTVVDLSRNEVLKSIPISGEPHHVSLSGDQRHAYVSVRQPVGIKVIDVATQRVTGAIPVEPSPISLQWQGYQTAKTVYSRSTRRVIAATSIHYALQSFSVPEHTPVGSLALNQSYIYNTYLALGASPDGSRIFMSGAGPLYKQTWIIDAASLQVVDSLTNWGNCLVAHPDGKTLCLSSGFGPVQFIDLETRNVDEVAIPYISGSSVAGAVIRPDGAFLYLVDNGLDSVVVLSVNPRRLVTRVSVGQFGDMMNFLGTAGIAISRDGGEVYVATASHLVIIETSGHTVRRAIPLGVGPILGIGNAMHSIAVLEGN